MPFHYLSIAKLKEIANALINSPLGYTSGLRNILFAGISNQFKALLPTSDVPQIQLLSDLNNLNTVKKLTDGTIPLEIWLSNASNMLSSFPDENRILQNALFEVSIQTTNSAPIEIPAPPSNVAIDNIVKEKSIHRNDMVSFDFLKRGFEAGISVARLQVARFDNGQAATLPGGAPLIYLGTGWLVTNDLMITNHHVINARGNLEANASTADFNLQADHTIVQFDFNDDNMQGTLVNVQKLETADMKLDYAILRLAQPQLRDPMKIFSEKVVITETNPQVVNIIQHPFGKSKKVAIRNNHVYDSKYPGIRYFTDTEAGSSGSPVFNDNWQVIALHRASIIVNNVQYNGQTTAWVNEGIQIAAVLENLLIINPQLAAEINSL